MATTPDTAAELTALEKMTAGQLRERYRELFGEEPRSWHRQWLFRRCAWRLQMLAEGDLSVAGTPGRWAVAPGCSADARLKTERMPSSGAPDRRAQLRPSCAQRPFSRAAKEKQRQT